MSSLRKQLTLALALGLTLTMGLLWLGGSQAIRTLTEHFVLSRLSHDSDALLTAVSFDESGRPRLDHRRLPPLFEQPYSGHYYSLATDDGKVVNSRSLWDYRLQTRPLAPGEQQHWRAQGPSGQWLLVYGAGYRKSGRSFTLTVTEDMAPLERRLERFQWMFALLAALALLVLLLLQWVVLQRGFGRLEPVREQLRKLEAGELRKVSEAVPLEIRPLVQQINRLLELMQQRLEHSRNGLGNLTHALKGPLNLLLQQLHDPAIVARPQLKQAMQQQLERIRQLVERELKRARMAGQGVPGSLFCPQQELPAMVGLLQQIHAGRRLHISGEWPQEGTLPVDREDLFELLGNLLDNACKWARSRVWISLWQEQGVRLVVEDDGPGVAAAERERLALRGTRVDESVSGHGLGLAICSDLVKGYGGRLEFTESKRLGGLRVEVWLPLPMAPAEGGSQVGFRAQGDQPNPGVMPSRKTMR